MFRRTLASRVRLAVLAGAAGLVVACSGGASTPSSPTGVSGGGLGAQTGQTATVLVAGDIGMCGSPGTAAVAKLVDSLNGTVILAGDIAYPHGSFANFRDCFEPAWGRFRNRWLAVPGNHEYESPGAAPYFAYFGEAALGPDGLGYYSVRLGDWLVLLLNSNIPAERGTPQYAFASSELAGHRAPCAMAVWHHPVFSSGPNGRALNMRDMFALLVSSGAEVVVNGHDHLYERFARQAGDGRPDPVGGVRQFTAGTGGAELYGFVGTSANSEFRLSEFGVLRLTLRPAAVQWEYLTTGGRTVDQGLDTCR